MAAKFQLVGAQSNVDTLAQIDPSYDALRVSIRPFETQTDPQGPLGGHYFISGQTGTLSAAIANNAQLWQVRWADPTKLFILKKLKVQACTLTGFAGTSVGCPLQLFIGHGSTANGTGGTSLAIVAGKGRSGHGQTSFVTSGEIRVAGTAGMTAATGQTLEATAIGGCQGAPNATISQSPEMYLFEQRDYGDHPLILVAGDTLAVTTSSPAATGTAVFVFTMSWAESVVF